MKKLILLLVLLAAPLAAANPAKRYLSLKDDADLFVGEGAADLKEFGGDGLKALEAAKERARAALASSIQVRITSETTETSSNGKGGSTEEIQSRSRSLSDLVLENTHLEDFVDFPDKGRITVLATVSKEDYRRQLAGKAVKVYRSQYGLRLGVWGMALPSTEALLASGQAYPADGKPVTMGGEDSNVFVGTGGNNSGNGQLKGGGGIPIGFALEFIWRGFVASLNMQAREAELYVLSKDSSRYFVTGSNITLAMAQLGYDWEPWAWRLQPFFPLRLNVANSSWNQYMAVATGASAGAGLRYWPNDSLSFEVSFRAMVGISGSEYTQDDGRVLKVRQNQAPRLDLSGSQTLVALQWSGF
jgi:hypothetical protein